MHCTKNPNKRAHDLNDTQTATTGLLKLFFNDSIFFFSCQKKKQQNKN